MADTRANGDATTREEAIYRAFMVANQWGVDQGQPWWLDRDKWRSRGRGDIDSEAGYETSPDIFYFHNLYARSGPAARCINIWPDECWAAFPELFQDWDEDKVTPFEKAWKKVLRDALPWHYLWRADRLSRVGRYGALLLGFDDGRPLSEPVAGIDPDTGETDWSNRKRRRLLYLRTFDELYVKVKAAEQDGRSPRFGQPKTYSILFGAPAVSGPGGPESDEWVKKVSEATGGIPLAENEVHWTRIIHLAENRHSSEVYATPTLRGVIDFLHDLRKVSAGAGEMFWRGGFPGYAFETYPDLIGRASIDEASVKQAIQDYQRGFQRYLATVGGKWSSLSMQVADPSGHVDTYLKLICCALGVPLPVFLGMQAGHQVSVQNAQDWKERLRGRQVNYLEPMVVRPFVNRLIAAGVLPGSRTTSSSGVTSRPCPTRTGPTSASSRSRP
jgi:hypothetical protein